METLPMSARELGRLKIMAGVEEEEVTLIAASGLMGGELSAGQAHLAAVSGRRRRRVGASVAGQAQRAGQAACVTGASAGPVRGATV